MGCRFKAIVDKEIAEVDFKSESARGIVGVNGHITNQEVESEIARMGDFKTPGPDLIHHIFLKKGGYYMRRTLTVILNTSFLLGKVPFLWRVGNVTLPRRSLGLISHFFVLFLFRVFPVNF